MLALYAVLNKNDYSRNVKTLGVVRNHKILLELLASKDSTAHPEDDDNVSEDEDNAIEKNVAKTVGQIFDMYFQHPTVVGALEKWKEQDVGFDEEEFFHEKETALNTFVYLEELAAKPEEIALPEMTFRQQPSRVNRALFKVDGRIMRPNEFRYVTANHQFEYHSATQLKRKPVPPRNFGRKRKHEHVERQGSAKKVMDKAPDAKPRASLGFTHETRSNKMLHATRTVPLGDIKKQVNIAYNRYEIIGCIVLSDFEEFVQEIRVPWQT